LVIKTPGFGSTWNAGSGSVSGFNESGSTALFCEYVPRFGLDSGKKYSGSDKTIHGSDVWSGSHILANITGAAIHRRLLAALQPAVLIVEEAAEVKNTIFFNDSLAVVENKCYLQRLKGKSCVLCNKKTSVADPGCLSRILIFTHPGSRIRKQQSKERGEKQNLLSYLFL
jgi:hypothetical protein